MAPTNHIVPADIDRQHGGGAGLLHDRVVDGDVMRGGKRFLVEPQEDVIGLGACERVARGIEDARLEAAALLQIRARVQNEDAAFPEVLTRLEYVCSVLTSGFSAKAATENAPPLKPSGGSIWRM